MKIKDLRVRTIFDSRGGETIQVEIINESGVHFLAAVPAGKSTGEREVKSLGAKDIVQAAKRVKSKILNKTWESLRDLDDFIAGLDGTKDKSVLGGNLSLGISIASARAFAFEAKREVWEELRNEFFSGAKGKKLPMLFSNLINGGEHAKNGLDIQEYMAVAIPKKSIQSSVSDLISVYKRLGASLGKKHPGGVLPIGDEGGYAVSFKSNFEPLSVLSVAAKSTPATDFALALDVAASSFFAKTGYKFEGKLLSSSELQKIYLSFARKVTKLISIEDPFAENDFSSFGRLLPVLPNQWIVGDDLTTTSPESISFAADNRLISGVIIKPNQIGSVSAACDAILVAQAKKVKVIVSHRSGEVGDDFIVHLARASNADALKIGAPIHERMYKFNETIRVYE